MYHFRFEIPRNADGSIATYPEGWHGTMPNCPHSVTVLLYNDREGYGIAQTEDTFKPKQVKEIEEAEALGTLTEFMDSKDKMIFMGATMNDRYIPEPVKPVSYDPFGLMEATRG